MNRSLQSVGRILLLTLLLASSDAVAKDKLVRPALETYLKKLGYGVIPLRRSDGNQFMVDGRIGDRKRVFMVDTGCTLTALDVASARQLKTPKDLGITLEDPLLGKLPDHLVLIPELAVGSARFANQPAAVLRLGTTAYDYHGLIGMDFMRRNQALFDCVDGRLYVRARPSGEAVQEALESTLRKNGYQEVPMRLDKAMVFLVTAEIKERKLSLVVDTGASFTVIDDKAAKECGLNWEKTYMGVAGIGKIGIAPLLASSLPELRLNNRKFPLRNLAVGGADLSRWELGDGTDHHHIDGLLGADLLASGQVLLDLTREKLWFLPQDAAQASSGKTQPK